MAVTRIKNNQVTDAAAGNTIVGINANTKLQNYSITSAKLANNLTYGSDLTITGNLTVQGNTTQIDTTITTIEDPVIVLASTQTTGTPTVDIGFLGYRGNVSNIAFVWDESADEFVTAFTSTGETNTVITITSYADFHTNNANIGGNLIVGGNISITGNVASLNVTGNITGGNLLTPGVLSAAGNATGGNVLTGGLVSATANVTGGNLLTGGLISATSTITSAANITGGNILTGGLISATATITGGNLATGGTVSATANITGGNVLTGGLISATSTITSAANITGGNVLTGGLISATSTITSAANITGGNILTGGLISATSTITSAANITGGNLLTGGLITSTGNITGGNILTGGLISATSTITSAANITGGNVLTGGVVSATANITGGNILTGGLITATANITGGNILTAGLISATSTITSAANITGGNVLTGGLVSATANVTGGNVLTGGLVSATGTITSAANITGGNLLTGGLISATGNITGGNVNTPVLASSAGLTIKTTASNGNISIQPNGTGNIVLGGNTYVNGVSLQPVQDNDVASKYYVDIQASTGLTVHEAVVVATTGNLATATGGTITYTQPNGASNGVGALLTTTGSFNLIDSANVQTLGTRILVKNEGNAVFNGVYTWANATNLVRSVDADQWGLDDADALSLNSYFFVTGGNINLGAAYVVDAPSGTITFGTSNIQFAQFSQAQIYSANTAAGLILVGQTFSAKVDNNTTAFDGTGNIIVKAGANLTTPNIGAATGTSLSVTGNVNGGNVNTAGLVTATGNVTGGNIVTGGVVTATANITGGNILTGGLISATSTITSAANVTGGNLLTSGLISATSTITSAANITGGNITTSGLITATGNVTGGNLVTGGLITATGNVQGGNIRTAGLISATSNITGGNLLYGSGIVSGTGNVYAANFIGNISGNIDAGGANTNIQFNDSDVLAGSAGFTFDKTSNAVVANGNITGSNFGTAGVVTATGNITGGNVLTGGLISATSTITSAANITGGNLLTAGLISATSTITSAANITGGNISTAGLVTATGNVTGGNVRTAGLITATGNITGANLILTTGIIDGPAAGRITINGSDIDTDFAVDGDTLANVFYVDAGTGTASFGSSTQTTNAIVAFNATTSILTPVGNTAQRPGTGVTGMLRFNSTSNSLEIYDNSQWSSVGVPSFTVIDDEQFAGDGSTVAFTLGSTQTTNSCIVSINGVVQIPTLAYSVAGTDPTCVLTFTEAPASGDVIDVRQITTTTTVTSISNSPGNAVISVSATTGQINITGNVVPSANITYDLGTTSLRWNDLYLAGNSIVLGNTVIKNTSGNSIGFFGPDGTTPATIDAASVDTTTIANGTSNVKVVSSNGNISVAVGGSGIVTFTSAGIINNMGNGVGNIGNSTGLFNTVFAKATSAQYADLAEKYTADADYAPGTVVMFGGSAEVTLCVNDACARIAGVISTNPSYRMNDGLQSAHTAMVALTGRVPTRVTGRVRKGDMMVSAGNGTARAEANPEIGTVIGKALADHDGADGMIEVVVGRV